MNLSYIHYKSEEPGNTWFPTIATPVGTRLNRKTDATQANSTFIANPSTVIDVRWGFNRFPNLYRTVSAGFNPATLGFTGSWLGDIQYLKFPRFDMSSFSALGAENDAQWAVYHSQNLLGNMSKLIGRHSLRMGGVYREIEIVNQPFGYSAGQFSFSDTFTRSDYRSFDGRTGSNMADLLLGYPTGGTAQTSIKFFQYVKYYAGYLQDNFRLNPKVTLNLGLRYEWEPGMADRNNALIVGFDRQASNPIGQGAKGTLLYAGVDGNPTTVLNASKTKFAPRIGAAWAMNDKTTFRAGYGLFWAPPSYAGFNTLGYTQISQFLGTLDGGRTPNGSLVNPFPTGLVKPVGNAAGKLAGIGQSISFPDQFATSPRMRQFSFDVQRILPGQIVFTAGYVGSRSRKFLLGTGTVNINQLTPDQARLGQSLFDLVDNPFFNRGGAGVIAAAQIQRAQTIRPFPEFGTVGLTFGDFNHARYDSMVIKVEKRFSKGLSFLSSWTWAQNKDIALGPPNNQNPGAGGPQNTYELEAEYSLSLLDIQHRVTGALSYALPFGKGKQWLGNNRALDFIAGGWEVNMVAYLQTGFPLPLVQPNQNGILGASVQRPNLTVSHSMPW